MTGIEVGALLTWASVASTVISAVSAYQGGRAQEANYKAAARASEYDALVKEQNAAAARQQAGAREEAQRRRAKQIMGEARAGFAQSGMGLGGSYGAVLSQSAAEAEIDALNIRYEGELQALGLLEGAKQSRLEGQMARANAKSARRSGMLNTASALLSGGVNTYGVYRANKTNRGAT